MPLVKYQLKDTSNPTATCNDFVPIAIAVSVVLLATALMFVIVKKRKLEN